MKLIEAEKAKDVIHEYFKSLMVNGASGTDVDRLAVGIGSCLKHDANLLKAIDKLPSVQPEQHWIPCSERLPEDDTEVLVYLFENNKSPYIAWLSDGRWYTEYFEVEREDEPVAWMPLPEYYQEGEQE